MGTGASTVDRNTPISLEYAKEGYDNILCEIREIKQQLHPINSHTSSKVTSLSSNPLPSNQIHSQSNDLITKSNICDVMLSIHCKTMLHTAQYIEKYLEQYGINVWICIEMLGGTQFRDDIITAVDTCKVFIPLINDSWCQSKECKYEFNYAFRKNLTSYNPTKPVILPICFPDLDWNAYGHVRALLASTNALVYSSSSQQEVLESLLLSLRNNGIEVIASHPSQWNHKDVCNNLSRSLLGPIREKELDGPALLSMDEQSLRDMLMAGVDTVIQNRREYLSDTDTHVIPNRSCEEHKWEGWYKAAARTVNHWDGNTTTSNTFLVCLQDHGLTSSGLMWASASMHKCYVNTHYVMRGGYSDSGGFYFNTIINNKRGEEVCGQLRQVGDELRAYGCCSKYTWFGNGYQSYGDWDMVLYKLSKEEVQEAKSVLQQMVSDDAEDGLLETCMQRIGRTVCIDDQFDSDRTDTENSMRSASGQFVVFPPKDAVMCAGKGMCVLFNRPEGCSGARDYVAICADGSDTLITPDSYQTVYSGREKHGVVFYDTIMPSVPGKYDIVYFKESGESPVRRHPIRVVSLQEWQKA